jgi:hypothetical protein
MDKVLPRDGSIGYILDQGTKAIHTLLVGKKADQAELDGRIDGFDRTSDLFQKPAISCIAEGSEDERVRCCRLDGWKVIRVVDPAGLGKGLPEPLGNVLTDRITQEDVSQGGRMVHQKNAFQREKTGWKGLVGLLRNPVEVTMQNRAHLRVLSPQEIFFQVKQLHPANGAEENISGGGDGITDNPPALQPSSRKGFRVRYRNLSPLDLPEDGRGVLLEDLPDDLGVFRKGMKGDSPFRVGEYNRVEQCGVEGSMKELPHLRLDYSNRSGAIDWLIQRDFLISKNPLSGGLRSGEVF